jgi:hypothetical protein
LWVCSLKYEWICRIIPLILFIYLFIYLFYFVMGYLTVLAVWTLYSIGWWDSLWMMNSKGFGRKRSWTSQGTILMFSWKGWGQPWNNKVKIANVLAKIWTEHHLNTSLNTGPLISVFIVYILHMFVTQFGLPSTD